LLKTSSQRTWNQKQLIETWLADLAPDTRRKYVQILDYFAEDTGCKTLDVAMSELFGGKNIDANHMVAGWKSFMMERNLDAQTINNRLACVRSLVRKARELGLSEIRVDVRNIKITSRKDMSGLDPEVYIECLSKISSLRDWNIGAMMGSMGLRTKEIVGLTVDDVDIAGRKLNIQRKTYGNKGVESIPALMIPNLSKLIQSVASPFLLIGKARMPLGKSGMWRLIWKHFGCRPHGLRHTYATLAARKAKELGFHVNEIKEALGHKNVDTTLRYLDQDRNASGRISDAVADVLLRPTSIGDNLGLAT